jgi:tetratricopeptide (TPR) repeat protein
MKRSYFIIMSLLMATNVFAQKGVEDGSRYGHGQDSITCLQNISIYTEYVKTGNYADAYKSWKEVFTDAPLAQMVTYTNGVKILKDMYQKETDPAKKEAYANELMQVYEQRLKYLPELNKFYQNQITEYEVKGAYAHDYISYTSKLDLDKAYKLIRDAVDLGKGENQYYVFGDLMKISSAKYAKDANFRDNMIQDYLDASTYINTVIAGITDNEALLDASRKTKDNIDAYFIRSGAADCDNLQAIYGPKIEENKTNLEYLNKVVSIMSMLKCTSSDAYFAAAEYSYNIAPSSKSAQSLGVLYYDKRNDTAKALEYFNQAIDLEEDPSLKSEYYYKTAVILKSLDQRSQAKNYLQKAISLNPNFGEPYIQLAQLYANNNQWCDEPALNQCTFYVVLDKLQTAKRMDPSVAEEADKLIKAYSEFTPKIEDLFMLSIKKGDKVEVKGWINETTTVR